MLALHTHQILIRSDFKQLRYLRKRGFSNKMLTLCDLQRPFIK